MATFKNIFEKLNLGTIEPNEEKIFLEVADKDNNGVIGIEDFRKILEYNVDGEDDEEAMGGAMNQDVYQDDMEGDEQQEFDEDENSSDDQ